MPCPNQRRGEAGGRVVLRPGESSTIYTVGSSTRQAPDFVVLLECYQIATLVDVGTYYYSNRFHNFSEESLEGIIHSAGLGYVYLGKDLGGFRPGDYGAYMQSAEFAQRLNALIAIAREGRAAFICSERLPWRCHRRFVASELEARGWRVTHIIDKDRIW